MSRIVHIDSPESWAAKMAESKSFGGKAVVVDFFAEWCGPCKVVAPFFEQLSSQYPAVTFLKVDVDSQTDVAQQCGIRAMPTFQAFFNGEKVDEVVGADQKKLQAMVEKVASQAVSLGSGQKLGGSPSPAGGAVDDSPEARRARMLAAAEARNK